jgi:hypothetical protein
MPFSSVDAALLPSGTSFTYVKVRPFDVQISNADH